jgi:GntR family transcriptional regulator, transcriptional repressor for pyruvate dehydrogenase complex
MLHRAIIGASKNQLLIRIYGALNSVRYQAEWGKLKQRSVTPERRKLYQEQHRRFVSAIADRDAEQARALLREHLLGIRANLFGS